MKQRFIRVGDEITDDTTLVIRGGLLDEMLLRADALRNHEIYGTYGISVESGKPIPDGRLEAAPTAERTAEEERARK